MKIIRSAVMGVGLLVVFIFCTNIVFAENDTIIKSGECGENVTWELNSEGVLTIRGKGEMYDYRWVNYVPDTPWYEYKNDIKKIVVEEGIVSIGNSSFFKLDKVEDIKLSDDVIAVGTWVFYGCNKITMVDLPDKLQYIGDNCFENCDNLKTIKIPERVEKIGYGAFAYCDSLYEVILPSKIEYLPKSLFYECISLQSIEIPRNVSVIPFNCFAKCYNLNLIKWSSSLQEIDSSAFSQCELLESLDIPDTVTKINSAAFANCSNLKDVKLPANLSKISSSVFSNCTSLESIEIPYSVIAIESYAFNNCQKLNEIILYDGLEIIEKKAFYNCVNLNTIFLPRSVSNIDDYAIGYRTDTIMDEENQLIDGVKIYCYAGTKGEGYAKSKNIAYSLIDISLDSSQYEYTGEQIIPNIKVVIDNKQLKENEDYTVEYKNNTEIGTAVAKIKFINEYSSITSIVAQKYEIAKLISKCEVKLDKKQYFVMDRMPVVSIIYNGEPLKINEDYALTYELAGTSWEKHDENDSQLIKDIGKGRIKIVGKGDFKGTRTIDFNVLEKKNINEAKIKVPQNKYKYTGKKITPEVTVLYNGTVLNENEDYILRYKNNVDVGIAYISIEGIEEYYGLKSKEFEIIPVGVDAVIGYGNLLRVEGRDRYDTALKISNQLLKSTGEDKFDNIIVACGTDYPDALSGSYLAKLKNAPILLVDKGSEQSTLTYIKKNLKSGGTVYLLGGEGVVSLKFENSVKAYSKVKRLAGSDRYNTNIEILKEAKVTNEDLLVCYGLGYADSLSASSVDKPILLTSNKGISGVQSKYLKTLKKGNIYLIGGNAVVSDKIGNQLSEYDKDGQVERVGGLNRYETSVSVAKKFLPSKCEVGVFAYAQNFPDGLSGGPLAISINSPMLLVDSRNYQEAKSYANKVGINKAVVIGGESLIDDIAVLNIINN